jgi:tetraacyldisaccharide-1-P 4'-kinase
MNHPLNGGAGHCGAGFAPSQHRIDFTQSANRFAQWPSTTVQWVIHGAHSPLQLLSGNAAPEGNLQALSVLQNRQNTRMFAAAGLAQPDRFYVSLAGAGLRFKTLSVADHGMISHAQWASIPPESLLLVTEKDAVKLRHANVAAKYQRMVRIVPWRVTLPTALVDTIASLLMR